MEGALEGALDGAPGASDGRAGASDMLRRPPGAPAPPDIRAPLRAGTEAAAPAVASGPTPPSHCCSSCAFSGSRFASS